MHLIFFIYKVKIFNNKYIIHIFPGQGLGLESDGGLVEIGKETGNVIEEIVIVTGIETVTGTGLALDPGIVKEKEIVIGYVTELVFVEVTEVVVEEEEDNLVQLFINLTGIFQD